VPAERAAGRAAPGDAQRIDVVRVPVQDRSVDHRRQQVVQGADRMDVAREVKVQLLHWDDLRAAAARGAAAGRRTLDRVKPRAGMRPRAVRWLPAGR